MLRSGKALTPGNDSMLANLPWDSGVLVLFGGLLLVVSSILEFILGNTFSCVVFGQLGALDLPGNRSAEHSLYTDSPQAHSV